MGLSYAGVEARDIVWLPLFSRMLMEAGTRDYDATQLSRQIGTYTGGIGVSFYNDLKSKQPGETIISL
jgi:Zn-dependent M16 (insulinase) family peptidase